MPSIRPLAWIMILLINASSAAGFPGSGQLEKKVSDRLWIEVPKNLSVFHILVLLTPSSQTMKPYFGHELHQAAVESFGSYQDHSAVAATDRLFRQFHYFAFNYIAFFYSDFPDADLRRDVILPPEFEPMRTMIDGYISLVSDFYTQSGFDRFWDEHRDALKGVIGEMEESMPSFDFIGTLESFYHQRVDRYVFVPCPFMKTMGTHVEVCDTANHWTYFYIAGGDIYRTTLTNLSTAFHEFSHSFIEPVSARFFNQWNALADLYKPLRGALSLMGYNDWDRAFNEHMVRAAETCLLERTMGEESALKKIDMEKMNGFQLIERFIRHMKTFDCNRDMYPQLGDYYPVLIKDLSEMRIDSLRIAGPMGFYPEYRRRRCYVKGTVPGSVFEEAGIRREDMLLRVVDFPIRSEEDMERAKDKHWNHAAEGDSVSIVIDRDGQELKVMAVVRYITQYRYKDE